MSYITGRKIRWGLVGCGRISANHLSALALHKEDVELVAVCDLVKGRALAASQLTGAKAFFNAEEMLSEKLDIVSLCTPSGLHSSQTIFFAKHNIHVVTEKPMATTWEDGLKMVEACKECGTQLFVVKQNRFNTTLQLLKRAICEGRFGKIYDVGINVFWTRPQDYYDQAPWRGTVAMDGGAFMNQASHYVDLLTWLVGPLEQVFTTRATLARKIECEDTGVMALRWKNGALGSFNVTMLAYPSNIEGSILILGEKGTVKVGGQAVNKIEIWNFSDKRDYDSEVQKVSYDTQSVYGFGHNAYYSNVVGALRGLQEPMTNGEEGLNSLETLIAAYASANENMPIKLPLKR